MTGRFWAHFLAASNFKQKLATFAHFRFSRSQLCHINTLLYERVEVVSCTLDPGGNGIQIEGPRSRVYCAFSRHKTQVQIESAIRFTSVHDPTKRLPSHNQHPTTHDGVIAMPAHPHPISASRSWLCVIAQSSSHLWVPINTQAMDR
ncbi:hypothetical protein B0H14DRAFT_2607613 [Mycena olivaceomarginata]|nr:hypothetical protein B0H14DRAFT_2607613 [Mycena olivaceomarginata]